MGGSTRWPKPTFNVMDYGASPNASTTVNDAAFTAAVAACVAQGQGTILIPAIGTYLKTLPIVIDSDNIALVGYGNRLGAATIQITGGDPTYGIVVGNTRNVNNVLIDGLNLQGLANNTSTGGGINFRCTGGKIRQSRVSNFGGKGINVAAVTGTIFEIYIEDVTLIQNGRNTGTPDDNIFIANTVTDFEVTRLISLGDTNSSMTRHAINCAGGPGKFLVCHPYHANQDGLHITGNGQIQVIGGEYETNGSIGLNIISAPRCSVEAVIFFANVGSDLSTSSSTVVSGNTFLGTNNNVYATFATGIIADNIFIGTGGVPIWLDTGCATMSIHDNYIQNADPAIKIAGSSCTIHDNICLAGGIAEVTGANSNDIHDNFIAAGKTITQIGTATKIRNNPGYNPVGKLTSQPGVPGSTSAYTNTNGVDCTVYITGGTVTVIAIGTNATGLTSGAFRVPVGQTITLTYSVAPTWVWFGD